MDSDLPPPAEPPPPPPPDCAPPLPYKEDISHIDEMRDGRYNEERYNDGRYTTTTTVVETTEYIADDGPAVRFSIPKADCSYIRTLGGMVKIICIVLCFLCFIFVVVGAPGYMTGASWATFVCSIGMTITSTLLLLYIFRVVDSLPQIPWIVGEMCFCFAWTIFFFIAGSMLAVAASQYSSRARGWAIAAFFAFGAMCAYGFDCYLKFLSWRNNEVATGGGPDFLAERRARAQQV